MKFGEQFWRDFLLYYGSIVVFLRLFQSLFWTFANLFTIFSSKSIRVMLYSKETNPQVFIFSEKVLKNWTPDAIISQNKRAKKESIIVLLSLISVQLTLEKKSNFCSIPFLSLGEASLIKCMIFNITHGEGEETIKGFVELRYHFQILWEEDDAVLDQRKFLRFSSFIF